MIGGLSSFLKDFSAFDTLASFTFFSFTIFSFFKAGTFLCFFSFLTGCFFSIFFFWAIFLEFFAVFSFSTCFFLGKTVLERVVNFVFLGIFLFVDELFSSTIFLDFTNETTIGFSSFCFFSGFIEKSKYAKRICKRTENIKETINIFFPNFYLFKTVSTAYFSKPAFLNISITETTY